MFRDISKFTYVVKILLYTYISKTLCIISKNFKHQIKVIM